ncbi:MAG: SDR family NAD(P)-dependent oxidoreductase [Pseudomonadota bacterium]
MHDRVALVTGGGSGIGHAAVLEFARRGAAVAVVDIALEAAERIAAELRAAGGRALAIRADVSIEADVRAMVSQTLAEFGRLDFAFNNAGILGPIGTPLHELDEPAWDRVLDTNLKSVWLSMKHEIAAMLDRGGGSIVNNASIVGLRAATLNPSYGASKHGVVGLTLAAASYYGDRDIRVNAVCPGVVLTSMTGAADAAPDSPSSRRIARAPLRRGAQAVEVARAAVWLCSDEASYLTGVALPVDGGLSVLA